jgi:hypothetical protein
MELNTEIAGNETEVINSPAVEDAADERNAVSEEVTGTAEGDDTPSDDGEVDKEMKTIKKALNKKNRYIDNQRARIRALEAEIQKVQSLSKDRPAAPEMDKFDSVIDYMKADHSYTLEQKLAEQAQQQQLSQLQYQQQMARQIQDQSMAEHMTEMMTSNPDVDKTIRTNAPIIQAMPEHIAALMYEIDNAPAATYALAKEGRLQDIYSMPPAIAANYIVQAEQRGLQYLQQAAKPKVQAPAPIGSLKGAGKTSKSLGNMTPDEIVNKYIK